MSAPTVVQVLVIVTVAAELITAVLYIVKVFPDFENLRFELSEVIAKFARTPFESFTFASYRLLLLLHLSSTVFELKLGIVL